MIEWKNHKKDTFHFLIPTELFIQYKMFKMQFYIKSKFPVDCSLSHSGNIPIHENR